MKPIPLIIFALAAVTAHSQQADPKVNVGSLYGQSSNAYIDRVAHKKGDILLVIISESSASNFAANTSTSKNVANNTQASLLNAINAFFGPFSTGSTASNDAKGLTNQNASMTAQVSVTVKDVDESGNLMIEGTRTLVTNQDTQTFTISGVVRPYDINPDNTLASSKIANAQIKMSGKGQIADRQRKGVLTQILEWLF